MPGLSIFTWELHRQVRETWSRKGEENTVKSDKYIQFVPTSTNAWDVLKSNRLLRLPAVGLNLCWLGQTSLASKVQSWRHPEFSPGSALSEWWCQHSPIWLTCRSTRILSLEGGGPLPSGQCNFLVYFSPSWLLQTLLHPADRRMVQTQIVPSLSCLKSEVSTIACESTHAWPSFLPGHTMYALSACSSSMLTFYPLLDVQPCPTLGFCPSPLPSGQPEFLDFSSCIMLHPSHLPSALPTSHASPTGIVLLPPEFYFHHHGLLLETILFFL